jgi:hypothetical protein
VLPLDLTILGVSVRQLHRSFKSGKDMISCAGECIIVVNRVVAYSPRSSYRISNWLTMWRNLVTEYRDVSSAKNTFCFNQYDS